MKCHRKLSLGIAIIAECNLIRYEIANDFLLGPTSAYVVITINFMLR